MRKHPLIALTAFTALGVSAIAGTTTGPFHAILTSAPSTGHSNIDSNPDLLAARQRTSEQKYSVPTQNLGPSVTGGRDLVATHDVSLKNRSDLSSQTGLPVPPAPRHAVVMQAAVAAPAPAPAPAPVTPAPVVQSAPPAPLAPAGGVWYELRMCESSDNYAEDSGNGYYGAYQFSLSTWYGLGYSGLPSEASSTVQDQAAAQLQATSGWDQWPQCAAELGLY